MTCSNTSHCHLVVLAELSWLQCCSGDICVQNNLREYFTDHAVHQISLCLTWYLVLGLLKQYQFKFKRSTMNGHISSRSNVIV